MTTNSGHALSERCGSGNLESALRTTLDRASLRGFRHPCLVKSQQPSAALVNICAFAAVLNAGICFAASTLQLAITKCAVVHVPPSSTLSLFSLAGQSKSSYRRWIANEELIPAICIPIMDLARSWNALRGILKIRVYSFWAERKEQQLALPPLHGQHDATWFVHPAKPYFSSGDHTRIRLSLMKAHNNYYSTHLTISKINSRFQSTCHVQKGVWFDGVSHFRMGVKWRGQQWGPKMCNSIAGTHRKRSRSTRTAAGTRKNNSSQTTKLQTNYNEREPTT